MIFHREKYSYCGLLSAVFVSIFLNFSIIDLYPPWADEWLALCHVNGITLLDMVDPSFDFWNIKKLGFDKTIEAIKSLSGHPPMMTIFQYFTTIFLEPSIESLRMVSAFFGVASVIMIFFVLKRLGFSKAGPWGALILAFHPLFVYVSREGRNYSIWLFFILWHIGALATLVEKEEKRRWKEVIISGICASLTHYLSVFLLLAQLFWLLYLNIKKKMPLFKAFIIPIICGLPTVFWIIFARKAFFEKYCVGEFYDGLNLGIVREFIFRLPGIFIGGFPCFELPLWLVTLLIVSFFLPPIIYLKNLNNPHIFLLLLVFYLVFFGQIGVNIFYILVKGQKLFFFSPRYFLVPFGAFILILSARISTIKKLYLRIALGISLLCFYSWSLSHHFFNPNYVQNGYDHIIQALEPWLKKGTVIVNPGKYQVPVSRHILQRYGLERRWRAISEIPQLLSDKSIVNIISLLAFPPEEGINILEDHSEGPKPVFSIIKNYYIFTDRCWNDVRAKLYSKREKNDKNSVDYVNSNGSYIPFNLGLRDKTVDLAKNARLQIVRDGKNFQQAMEIFESQAFAPYFLKKDDLAESGDKIELSWYLSYEPPLILRVLGKSTLFRPSPDMPEILTLYSDENIPVQRAKLGEIFLPIWWLFGIFSAFISAIILCFTHFK